MRCVMVFQLMLSDPSQRVKEAVKLMDDCVSRILREECYIVAKLYYEEHKEVLLGGPPSPQEGDVG